MKIKWSEKIYQIKGERGLDAYIGTGETDLVIYQRRPDVYMISSYEM